MDTSAGFCFRYTLYTVYTTFVFKSGIGSLTLDHKCNFLKSTDAILIETHHLCLPSSGFRILHIHTVDLCSKKCRLITACTCTDLHDNILTVIRILRQKQDLEFLFQFFHTLLCIGKLFLEHFTHILILLFLQKRKTVLDSLFVFLIFCISIHDGLQITLLLHQLLKTLLVVCHAWFTQFVQYFLETNQQVIQFIKHAVPPAFISSQSQLCQARSDLSSRPPRQILLSA